MIDSPLPPRTLRFRQILWLMPCAFALHIAEELFGGFQRYAVDEMHGPYMPTPLFLLNNAVFMAILLALSAWASRKPSRLSAFALLSWASGNLFWAFIVHFLYTIITRVFSPGLVTATLFYYPIPFIVTALAVRERILTVKDAAYAFGLGAVLMILVLWGGLYHSRT